MTLLKLYKNDKGTKGTLFYRDFEKNQAELMIRNLIKSNGLNNANDMMVNL